MIEKVQTQDKNIKDYQKFISADLNREIKGFTDSLKGKKIVHINSTSRLGGGGVAEILHGLIPLQKSLGIETDWYVIKPTKKFFEITNKIHNSLQGLEDKLSEEEKKFYISQSKKIAGCVENVNADFWVMHDPQPLAIPFYSKKINPVISRIHIDIASPLPDTWDFIFPFFKPYKKIIVSTHEFINHRLPKEKVNVFPPAIDPLKAKNTTMKKEHARMILENIGINPTKPIISQVSRLDPFKDPIGVIKAFYLAKRDIPNLQLVLMAQNLANDNPCSKKIFEKVKRYMKGDRDIFLFYDPKKISYENDILVNAIQTASDVILQKSIREGFGLTITEAMWKEKAVIAGRVGGIKVQIRDGYNGYMVSSVEHCASKIVELLKDKKRRHLLGTHAKKSVAQNFLLPRLLRDHLEMASKAIR